MTDLSDTAATAAATFRAGERVRDRLTGREGHVLTNPDAPHDAVAFAEGKLAVLTYTERGQRHTVNRYPEELERLEERRSWPLRFTAACAECGGAGEWESDTGPRVCGDCDGEGLYDAPNRQLWTVLNCNRCGALPITTLAGEPFCPRCGELEDLSTITTAEDVPR